MLHVIHKMPYKKDFIGQTPYYVQGNKIKYFKRKDCTVLTKAMDKIGIVYTITPAMYGCKLEYQDNYDSYLMDLTSK